jgi:hypothetical protein
MDVAKQLGRYKYMSKILFRHLHPAWNLSKDDDLYKRNESKDYWKLDELNYLKRKKLLQCEY